MRCIRPIVVLLCLACLPALARAEAYYVAPVQGEGMDGGLLKTLQRLVAVGVSENGQTPVESEAQAQWALKAELLKLGEAYIVTLAKVKAGGSEVAFADKDKAASADELDGAVSRLTKRVLTAKPAEAQPVVTPETKPLVTPETKPLATPEAKPTATAEAAKAAEPSQAVASRKSSVFGFGPMRFNGLNTPENDPFGYYLAGGLEMDVNPHAAITLIGESSFKVREEGKGSVVAALQLGGLYFFSAGDISPFAGIDLGYGGAGASDANSVFGFAGGARLGIMFFRSSSAQLSLALRHLTIFENNGNGVPGHSGLVVGANF